MTIGPCRNGQRRWNVPHMDILIGLVVMLGFAVVVSGVLIVIAGLTGALGPDDPTDEISRVR
jgi:hypothetical protein